MLKCIQAWAREAHQWFLGATEGGAPILWASSAGREADAQARRSVRCPHGLRQTAVTFLNAGKSAQLTGVPTGMQGSGATLGPGLTSAFPLPPDYSVRHVGQFLRSNYIFLFQLPWLPEKLLSMSDFQVQ